MEAGSKMTVYTFQLPSADNSLKGGVEIAQADREKSLTAQHIDNKAVFIDLPTIDDLKFSLKVGFHAQNIISMHQYFTDLESLIWQVPLESVEAKFKAEEFIFASQQSDNQNHTYYKGGETIYIKFENNKVQKVMFLYNGYLIKTDFYGSAKAYTEYYTPKSNGQNLYAAVYKRVFYNQDGSEVYTHFTEEDMYVFSNGLVKYSRNELLAYFIEKLSLTKKDILVFDWYKEYFPMLLNVSKPAKVICNVHSEHMFENTLDSNSQTGITPEYDTLFNYADKIDVFVTPTKVQAQKLQKDLYKLKGINVQATDIAPGVLEKLQYPETKRTPYSLVTVSRIDSRKRLEITILAAVKAHNKNSNITLDIYGNTNSNIGYVSMLHHMIKMYHAEDYIKFKGYAYDVRKLLTNYEVFIAGSVWETFGISTLEALGSGLAVVGLDVPYGNQELITNDRNGYLVPASENIHYLTDLMAEKITTIYEQDNLVRLSKGAYNSATLYLRNNIGKKWEDIVGKLLG